MFTGRLSLTNPHRVPLALCNDFDNPFLLEDEIEECQSVDAAVKILNKYSLYRKWSLEKIPSKRNFARFKSVDQLGNIHYLLAYTEV